MQKHDSEKQHINCGCCGYDTCRDMAIAIYNGINHKHNCVHYIKDRAYDEKDRAIALTEEVKRARDEMQNKKAELAESLRIDRSDRRYQCRQCKSDRRYLQCHDRSR